MFSYLHCICILIVLGLPFCNSQFVNFFMITLFISIKGRCLHVKDEREKWLFFNR